MDFRSLEDFGSLVDKVKAFMREYVWLECSVCGSRNYRTHKETRGADRLELKKYCRKERKHTPHKESRKK
jgi:large subunit ribosomal protein L33